MKTPTRACDFCDDEEADGQFREVTGIEDSRKHKMLARRETGRIACWACARKLSAGASIDQLELSL